MLNLLLASDASLESIGSDYYLYHTSKSFQIIIFSTYKIPGNTATQTGHSGFPASTMQTYRRKYVAPSLIAIANVLVVLDCHGILAIIAKNQH